MIQPVEDRPTEKGILYNNILTFLILAVMSWVGVSIVQTNDILQKIQIDGALMQREQVYMMKDISSLKVRASSTEKEVMKIRRNIDNMFNDPDYGLDNGS